MATAYDKIWEKLNLDLDAHAGLLEVLGKFYGDIYLSQSGRLRGMEYLDFVLSEVHGLRIKELQDAKAAGKKIIGTFCVFVPGQNLGKRRPRRSFRETPALSSSLLWVSSWRGSAPTFMGSPSASRTPWKPSRWKKP